MQETSKLVGTLIADKDLKLASTKKMKEVDKDASIVSFAYLLDKNMGLRKNEIENLHKREANKTAKNIFKIALEKEFNENRDNYEMISKTLENIRSTEYKSKESSLVSDELTNFLVSEELQIFYPYDPDFEDADKSSKESSEFYTSFDPLDGSDTNIGYKYKNYSSEPQIVYDLDNDFLDRNHVYLIVPIDSCDMPNRECGFTDLQVYDPDVPAEPSTPGDPVVGPILLKDNYNHSDILPADILTSNMPRIMIAGTKWIGFAGTHQKLRIWRGTADGEVTQNSDGIQFNKLVLIYHHSYI